MNSTYNQIQHGQVLFEEMCLQKRLSDNDWLIFFPELNTELASAVFTNLQLIKKKKHAKRLILIVTEDCSRYEEEIEIWHINSQDMEDLLVYYRLIQFFSNIVVVSTMIPYGSAGIIGKKGITVDDYVLNGLFA